MFRAALIFIDPENMPETVNLIADHGLTIERSIDTTRPEIGAKVVGLIITGDQLPVECATARPMKIVMLHATTESYGSQRLTRISKIEVDEAAMERFHGPNSARFHQNRPDTADLVAFLNSLLGIDADAVARLVSSRVPCGSALADHPTVQVGIDGSCPVSETGGYTVGLLGVLNGYCGVLPDGMGPISAVYDESGCLKAFELTKQASSAA